MTRKEACEELRDLIVLYEMQNILPYLKDYHMDAFRVAIDALEQSEPINPCTVCQEFDCNGCKFKR